MRRNLIMELTPQQTALLDKRYKEWIKIGRSVEPINQEAATAVVNEFYRRLGKPAPLILTFSSPMMCVLAWVVLKQLLRENLRDKFRPQLWDQLWDRLRGQIRAQLWDQLGDQLWEQIRGQLGDQLWERLRGQLGGQLWDQYRGQIRNQVRNQLDGQLADQLWEQLGDQLLGQIRDPLWVQLADQLGGQIRDRIRDQIREQLWGQIRDPLRSQLGTQFWDQLENSLAGQHWAYFQAFYSFGAEIGAEYQKEHKDLLDLWLRECRSLHWWFTYEGLVLLSERHTAVHVDERGRLHREDGMACSYSDGWGIYAWHGVRTPDWIITQPEKITVGVIQTERNTEVRRILLERFGLDRFLNESSATLIQCDKLRGNFPQYVNAGDKREFLGYIPGEETISLYELPVQNADGRNAKVIQVTCPSTMRNYVLGVNPDHTRAIEAVAATFGLTEEQYRNMVNAHS